ncbi:methylated-DNA--[protein]-cysteine S-methyltransferase [Desulfoluna spongiiphila]|uniref:methylated-DNA--[protein]-cysteine S-methyltransferase n=1 Tax=Desulfoluna spongiiphila TaxID=419481 RepID=UPI001255D88F|nr:methylated-DNA--[protein]-cysteine S-methyltransferase [Desulfoluna spongiiphila]VVS92397.1 methylated-dna--protein-cysteine methyltransferase [Desulfoluna spongiiphila]
MTFYTHIDAPFCGVILAGDHHGLSHLHLCTGEGKRVFEIDPAWERNDAFFKETAGQVLAYFNGELKEFHVALNPAGTAFQKRVWAELTKIPFGELRTYKEVAAAMGNDNASRAVGMANSKNPIPLIVPCHRVVGADGKLTGFAHGLAIKERLIRLEQETTPCLP